MLGREQRALHKHILHAVRAPSELFYLADWGLSACKDSQLALAAWTKPYVYAMPILIMTLCKKDSAEVDLQLANSCWPHQTHALHAPQQERDLEHI